MLVACLPIHPWAYITVPKEPARKFYVLLFKENIFISGSVPRPLPARDHAVGALLSLNGACLLPSQGAPSPLI